MKKSMIKTLWAAISACALGAMGTLVAFAGEQETAEAGRVLATMDVLQKVSLIVVITVAVAVFIFYAVKMVLKKMYVAPEEDEKNKEE